ncbi:hypothetical protein BT96DRAFT_533455 [Gymnopus androsaceus JB14]|uniref:Nephrocystin 3-like N-terminal domain-containing protein n=1 Tax=Gymnopus androsaceus JB14 TaxID=1447944 RepID=A0A6A4IC30_9AGAR|nr:hypothetical protein BT96DRAFT_533455 [Gymnopus androsaceus JB14]
MSEYFGPSIQHKQGDTRLFENSSNFRINGGNFIVANDSANVTIQLHDQVQKINEWLKAPDCSTIFNTATNKKTAGTGVWIFKHPKYIEWNNNGGLLWIQGKAGSGKTVMS